ncbi:ABC transporter substrate-binding protein [Streptomyces sp. NPDC055078]
MTAVLAAVLAMGLLLTSCQGAGGAKPRAGQQSKDVLTIASTFPPLSLDPARSGGDNPLLWFIEPAYTPFLFRAADGYKPGLAVSWRYADAAKKVFELKLRDGVRFSDGAPLTADGVKNWLEYVPRAGGPFAASYRFKSVEVTGPLALRITLNKADPSLLAVLSHQKTASHVASPGALKDPRKLGTRTFGTGPYKLDPGQTITNQRYTYVPNEHYWDKKSVHFKKLVIEVMPDENATLLKMRSGSVDVMIGSPKTARSAKGYGLKVHRTPSIPALVSFMDREGALTPALADVRVRQALNHALDRKAIAALLSGDAGKPTQQLALPGQLGYSSALEDFYPHDVAKARRLLAEAGYPKGFTLRLYAYKAGPGWTESAQVIASQWAKIGVKVDVKVPASVTEWVGAVAANKVPAAMWLGKNDDMHGYTVERLLGFLNPQRTQDPVVGDLLGRIALATEAEQQRLWERIQRRWLEQAWFAPFSVEDTVYYSRPGLKGIEEQMAPSKWIVYANLQFFRAA